MNTPKTAETPAPPKPDAAGSTESPNATEKSRTERHILIVSIVSATAIAVFSIVWGIIISSQIIIFDGVASLISIALTGVSLITTDYIQQPEDRQFQFGRSQLQPLVVAFQALMMVMMALYALFTAVASLLAGGQPIQADLGILYALLSGLASFGVLYYVKYKGRHLQSGLIDSERNQWLMDGLLTVGVLIGFVIAMIMKALGWEAATNYVDPIMVILIVVYFLGMPVRQLVGSFREMLLMAPDEAIQQQVEAVVQEVCAAHSFERSVVRMTKIGQEIPVHVGIIARTDHAALSIQTLDQIRTEIYTRLSTLDYTVWPTVVFTTDEQWV